MAINVPRGKRDDVIVRIIDALKSYQREHSKAQIDLYRQNSVSVRIRIIDSAFQGLDKAERHSKVWRYFEQLPEDVQSDISMLLLLTPTEKGMSFGNFEFDDPVPSRL